jgi:hypothetical protein
MADFVESDAAILWVVEEPGVFFGWAVADLRDIDGDSVPEVITGDPFGNGYAGSTVILSGRDGQERLYSPGQPGSLEGYSVADAGDQDGDGVNDLLSGAPGLDSVILYSGATGEVLRTLRGEPLESFGVAVGRAGDVDSDGVDELVVGAEWADIGGEDAGRVYLMSGDQVLWYTDGEAAGDLLGSGTGFLGDVTGDGVPDVAVGARGNGGRVYVLSGADGSVVHTLVDPAGGGALGSFFVSGVGDIDGDSVPDVYGGDYAVSRVHVWSGATGAELLVLQGETPQEGLGPGRYAGDVDGDAVPDLAVGSYLHSAGAPTAGRVTVFSGADGSVLRTVTSVQEGENFGFDAIGLGDVDGDGAIELLVSAATGNRVYLVGTVGQTDTAADTSADTADTGTSPPPGDKEGCGCRQTGPSWGGLLALLWLRRRTR